MGEIGDVCKRRRNIFEEVRRPAYLEIDLDAVENNIKILRKCAKNPKIAVVGMVKGDAYGHGLVPVARRLKSIGVERLAVATIEEAMELRNSCIKGPLHLFGNTQGWELKPCIKYDVIPTVVTEEAILAMGKLLKQQKARAIEHERHNDHQVGTVHIKIDTGMSRNGCQPQDLRRLMKLCRNNSVPVEGIFTHLANYEDEEFTKAQMDSYYKAIEPYRGQGLLFHVANSGGILTGVGTDLDIMRPGIALYGLPPGEDMVEFEAMGFKPVPSLYAEASLVKKLKKGRKIGYGCTYICEEEQWVATIPVGYADGYPRHLSNKGTVIRERTGERCPVVGRVSMDAITVRVESTPVPEIGESFVLMTADYDPCTSTAGVAKMLSTIPYELTTRFQLRLPRYYTYSCNKMNNFVQSLSQASLTEF